MFENLFSIELRIIYTTQRRGDRRERRKNIFHSKSDFRKRGQ